MWAKAGRDFQSYQLASAFLLIAEQGGELTLRMTFVTVFRGYLGVI